MSRRSALAALGLGGVAGLAWAGRAALKSLIIRALSLRIPNAATRRGVGVDLGPARGRWMGLPLAADLGPTLSEVVGAPVEAAAYSRFGGFALGRRHSAYLDPSSPYYQAWLGAYVVFDSPERPPFGFDSEGNLRPSDVIDALDADQRLVYRSIPCPYRFEGGRTVRPISDLQAEPTTVDGQGWWRLIGEAETWSTYHRPGLAGVKRRARWLYGTPPNSSIALPDFPPIRYAGEFWLRHDPALGATCAAFLVAPYQRSPGTAPPSSQPLLLAARPLLRQVRFSTYT